MVDSGSLSQPVSLPFGHVPVPMIMVGKIKTPTEKDLTQAAGSDPENGDVRKPATPNAVGLELRPRRCLSGHLKTKTPTHHNPFFFAEATPADAESFLLRAGRPG